MEITISLLGYYYMQVYKASINLHHFQSWEHYLMEMSKPGTWVDHPVVEATAQVIQHPIHIYTASEEGPESGYTMDEILCEGRQDVPPLLLGHVLDLTYMSLTEYKQPGAFYCITIFRVSQT